MPQRTNEFQELVSLVQKALAPSGAKVTDSALIDVPGLSEPREIDVLIESAVGPYRMKIAVEAKDHRRKLDTTQFESLIGKYFVEGGVRVNKVVVVTHTGFYEPVIERAKRLGVELFTLKEAKNVDWKKYRPFPTPFKTAPRICDVEILPPISEEILETVIREGRVVCSHGTDFGNVRQFAMFLLLNNVLRIQEEVLRQIDDAAANEPEGKRGHVEFTPDHPHAIRLSGEEFPFDKLTFIVHFSKDNIPPGPTESEFHFEFAPHVCKISTDPQIDAGTNNELRSEGRLVCLCCGKDHGTLNEWANRLICEGVLARDPETVKRFQDELRKSPVGQAWLTVNVPMDSKKVIRFRDKDFPVSSVSVTAHAVSGKGPVECKHYELTGAEGEGKLVTHLEATAGGKKFSIVIPHVDGGHADKIVLRIDDAKPSGSSKSDE